jgi:hypothetical protein
MCRVAKPPHTLETQPFFSHTRLVRERTAIAVPATIMIRATFPQASKIPHIVVSSDEEEAEVIKK